MKNLLTALLFASFAATSLAQTSAAPTDTEKSKAAAASLAAMMRGSAPVIQNGELTKDGNNVQSEQRNSGSMAKQLDYVKGVTGLEGAAETGNPARGVSAGATASATSYVDFSCVNEATSRKSAGGFTFQLEGCVRSSETVVTSVKLRMCSATSRGGVCSPAAFGASFSLPSGSYVDAEGSQLGLGCNASNGACRLTVKSSYGVKASTADFENQVREQGAAQAADTNSAQSDIVKMRTNTDANGNNVYEAKMADSGRSMVSCAQENNRRIAAGQAPLTCDGTKQVDAGTAQTNPQAKCDGEAQCVRKATRESQFSRSCMRSFPLTSKVCSWETKTKECTVNWVREKDSNGQYTGKDVEESSCTTEDITGASKFSSKNTTCYTPSFGSDGSSDGCAKWNRVDYYAWEPQMVGACYGDPYVPDNRCVNDPKQVDTQCTSNRWFGRTKTAAECMAVDFNDPDGVAVQVGETVIAGCGVCEASQTGMTCYARLPLERDAKSLTAEEISAGARAPEPDDTCSSMDLAGCSLSGTEDVIADDTGLVTSRRENYTCTRTTEACVEYKKDPACQNTTVSTWGLEAQGFKAAGSDEAMNQALASTAVASALGGAIADSDGNVTIPLLFTGNGQKCDKPTGSWGSNGYYMDCCRISLERPGGKFGKLNKCTEENARLAAARRANYTVYIGDYCSKKLGWPLKKCIRRTQTYCVFPGILPRIIHEQGRKQLADMAKSGVGASTQTAALSFDYYGTSGSWSSPVTANNVTVRAWQFPSYCRDVSEAEKMLEKDPLAKECPTQLVNYFAVCDNPAGCGALPEVPELGAEEWVLSTADPIKQSTTAVSRYAVVHGSCDPRSSKCNYELSAWPAGIGGRAVVSKQLSFQVYTASKDGATMDEVPGELANVGDYVFRPMTKVVSSSTYPASLPPTVKLNYSSDGGQTWKTLNVPTSDNNELDLSGTDAKLSGSCSLETNVCQFKMTGTATVTALPWGDAWNPNCKGFTAGQISVLDFSKMDFTEWISSVAGNISGPNGGSLTAMTQSQVTKFNEAFTSGGPTQVTMEAPQGVQVARMTPSEGFGPFNVTVKVGGHWPVTYGDPAKDTDPITSVLIDWGDCTDQSEPLQFVSSVNGQAARGFLGTHTYTRPQDVPAACGGGETNLTHTATLKVTTTKSGVKTVALKVKNAFNTMPGAYRQNTENSASHTPSTTVTIPGKDSSPTKP